MKKTIVMAYDDADKNKRAKLVWRNCYDCGEEMLRPEPVKMDGEKRIYEGFSNCPYCGSKRFGLIKGISINDAERSIARRFLDDPKVVKPQGRYVEDGVVDEDAFCAADVRYVFILKESNDLGSSLVDFLRKGAATEGNGNGGHTFNPMCRWLDKNSIGKRYSSEERAKILKKIAVVNVKKFDEGHAVTDTKELSKFVGQHDFVRKWLRSQLSLYVGMAPVIFVCCGPGIFDLVVGKFFGKDITNIDHNRKPTYCEIVRGVYVMAFNHPNARKGGLDALFKKWTQIILNKGKKE